MKSPFINILLFLLFCSCTAFSQLKEIRQLQRNLPFITDSALKINALNRIGNLLTNHYPDSSYVYASEAKKLAGNIGYIKGIADADKTYGILLTGQNSFLAATYLNQCLEQYRAINDKEGECMVLMNIANLLYVDQDSVNAHAYLLQSYRVGLTVPKDSVLFIIINNINLHNSSFINPATTSLFKRGSAIASKYHDERMVLYYKLFNGYREWFSGKKPQVIALLKSSLKSADSIGNEYIKLSIYLQLGFRSADSSISIDYFKKGLIEATSYHFEMFKSLFAQNLYNYYDNMHNSNEAAQYAAILLETKDQQATELHKYGFNVINYVRKDEDLKLINERERTRTLLMIVFICLFITAIALLFFVVRSAKISRNYAAVQKAYAEKTNARNLELENWNKFNDMLIAVLAHDLRQPFASIIMTSEMLKLPDDYLSEDDLQTIMFSLNDTASKSIELLEGLLLWVKSKKENFEYITQPLLLRDNIEEANGLYKQDQQNKHISISNQIPAEQVIYAHKQMQLFINRNLISNATKYSPDGGTIRIFNS